MKTRGSVFVVAVVVLMALTAIADAVETNVTVRVISKDAKFIGSSMGGALVTIRNADTGELLAQGLTEGATGNTGLLMKQEITRRTPMIDEKSAKFEASVEIDEPTLVEIRARGPMAQRQATAEVSVTQWLIPGRHIVEGNAVLLEISGFVVDVLAPPAHVKLKEAPQDVAIRANLTMM